MNYQQILQHLIAVDMKGTRVMPIEVKILFKTREVTVSHHIYRNQILIILEENWVEH